MFLLHKTDQACMNETDDGQRREASKDAGDGAFDDEWSADEKGCRSRQSKHFDFFPSCIDSQFDGGKGEEDRCGQDDQDLEQEDR